MSKENIPHTWSMVALRDIGDWRGGGTPSKLVDEYWNGNVPWVSPKDMKQDLIFDSADHITEQAIDESAANLIPANSILCVTRSGILAHTFPVSISMVPVTVNQDLKALTPFDGIDPRYVAWVLRAQGRQILETCSKDGTTVNSIDSARLYAYRVPLAPQQEQLRVVAKLAELFSELDNSLDSLQIARQELQVYRQALLKHAFEGKLTADWRKARKRKLKAEINLRSLIQGERSARYEEQLHKWRDAGKHATVAYEIQQKATKPRKPNFLHMNRTSKPDLPDGWDWELLGNLNTDVFDGPFGSSLKTSDYTEEGVRVIRLENIGSLKFIDDKASYISEKKFRLLQKHTVHAGDIIVASFVIDSIRLAILPETIDRAVNKADCFCVRMHGESVRADYVASFLSMRAAYKQLEAEIHGIGRPRINTTQLKHIAIPLCDHIEQDEVMFRLSRLLSLADNTAFLIETEINKCEALRQSILQKAFSGGLVAQDPNDEPASMLLKRLKEGIPEPGNDKEEKINKRAAA